MFLWYLFNALLIPTFIYFFASVRLLSWSKQNTALTTFCPSVTFLLFSSSSSVVQRRKSLTSECIYPFRRQFRDITSSSGKNKTPTIYMYVRSRLVSVIFLINKCRNPSGVWEKSITQRDFATLKIKMMVEGQGKNRTGRYLIRPLLIPISPNKQSPHQFFLLPAPPRPVFLWGLSVPGSEKWTIFKNAGMPGRKLNCDFSFLYSPWVAATNETSFCARIESLRLASMYSVLHSQIH